MTERLVSLSCPAKINLLLAITGRRADGFHELVSLVAPLTWGDDLQIAARADGRFVLGCDDPAVPLDGTNLVLKAAEAFRTATGWTGGAEFRLTKRIPIGAGLGGGSSNAATALRGLNELAGHILDAATLAEVAAKVGSDCALFLHDGPVVMRGRGERVEAAPAAVTAGLRGRRVLVFKPAFGIATAWAYRKMAEAAPASYIEAADAEGRLAALGAALAEGGAPGAFLFNNMEAAAFTKYPALPVLLARLGRDFGLAPRMSGSGSACFALLGADTVAEPVVAAIRESWGPSIFAIEAKLK